MGKPTSKHDNESAGGHRLTGTWQRPVRCTVNGCVEARLIGDQVTVRSSHDPDGPSVSYHRDEWSVFIAAVKAGEFDIS